MKRIEYKKGDIVGSNIFIRDLPSRRARGGQMKRRAIFLCSECGNEFTADVARVKKGHTYRCGCKPKSTSHRMTSTKYHNAWINIKQRCFNPRNKAYKYYGARGITICEEWVSDFMKFHDYISSLENYGKPGYSIDRKNNDGNYEYGNLRFATQSEQNSNKRSKKDMDQSYQTKKGDN